MSHPHWVFDDGRWPLLLLHVADGDGLTAPDWESTRRACEQVVERRGRKVVVVDLKNAKPDAKRRAWFIDWSKKNWASTRSDLVAVGLVAPGTFERSIITAILWFITPPCPMQTFESRDAALAWAAEQARASGLAL